MQSINCHLTFDSVFFTSLSVISGIANYKASNRKQTRQASLCSAAEQERRPDPVIILFLSIASRDDPCCSFTARVVTVVGIVLNLTAFSAKRPQDKGQINFTFNTIYLATKTLLASRTVG